MAQTQYVTAHPSRKEFAEGYAAGLAAGASDYFEEVRFEVVLLDDCPPMKIYVTAQPLTLTPAPE